MEAGCRKHNWLTAVGGVRFMYQGSLEGVEESVVWRGVKKIAVRHSKRLYGADILSLFVLVVFAWVSSWCTVIKVAAVGACLIVLCGTRVEGSMAHPCSICFYWQ